MIQIEPSGFIVRAYKLGNDGKPDMKTEHVERSRKLSYAIYRRNQLRFQEGYGEGEGMVFLGAELNLNWRSEGEGGNYFLHDEIEMVGEHCNPVRETANAGS